MEFVENYKSYFSISALKAAKKDPDFAKAVFEGFGFLIEKYGFEVIFDGVIRGWAYIFKKGEISIFVWKGIDEKLPQVWVEKETRLHHVHQSIEDLKIKFGDKTKISGFWNKIADSGKFLEINFQSVSEFLDELPKLKPITTRKLRT